MSRSQPQSSFPFGPASFSVGLALIASATIFNLCLDKLPPRHLYSLPDFIVGPYEQAGPLGLTLVLAGLGVMLVSLGLLGTLLRGKSTNSSADDQAPGYITEAADQPAQSGPPSKGSSRNEVAVESTSGKCVIVLESQKYVGKRRFGKAGASDSRAK